MVLHGFVTTFSQEFGGFYAALRLTVGSGGL
jgi:hypothetical protein